MYNPLDLGFLGRKLNDLQGLLPDLKTLLLVEGSGIEGGLLAVHEVFSRDVGHLIGCGQIDGGLGSGLGGLEETLGNGHHWQVKREGDIAPDARVDHAGMQEVHGHPGALQPLGQLPGEVDVGELGHIVQVGSREGANGVQFGQVNRRQAVQLRGHNNNTSRSALLQHIDEQVRQQEGTIVIGGHGQLHAILTRLSAEGQGHAGIVDQHIDLGLRLHNVSGELADRLLGTQIQFLNQDLAVVRLLDDLIC